MNKMRTPAVIQAINSFLQCVVSFFSRFLQYSDRAKSAMCAGSTQMFECSMRIEKTFLMGQKYGVPVSQRRLCLVQTVTDSSESLEKIDLVVTLGGDGTILHASSLFSYGAVPPVLSFSMGTLGFLLPFRASQIS